MSATVDGIRSRITQADIDSLVDEFRAQLHRRIQRKGDGCLISRHEVLGVVTEEYLELGEVVHSGSLARVREESWDVAIAGAIGAVSIDKGVEW